MYNFMRWIKNNRVIKSSKHQASKKNYKHIRRMSKGELNHLKFIQKQFYPRGIYKNLLGGISIKSYMAIRSFLVDFYKSNIKK